MVIIMYYKRFATLYASTLTAILLVISLAGPVAAADDAAEIDALFKKLGIVKIKKTQPVYGQVKDLNDKIVELSSFKGKIYFLTFWTTWCPTCKIEMPALQRLYEKFPGEDFSILAVNIQESAEKVAKYFKTAGLTYTPLLDGRAKLARSFAAFAVPTTFILNRDGLPIGKVFGSREWDGEDGVRLIELLLENDAETDSDDV